MAQYTITEKQIKSIAEGGGKKKIKEMFPQVFGNKLEVGKWYFVDGNKCGNRGRYMIANFSGTEQYKNYGFDFLGQWNNEITIYHKDLGLNTRPATDEEVEAALIAEAKRRGFVDGVYVKADWIMTGNNISSNPISLKEIKLDYSNDLDCRSSGGTRYTLFRDGKWAEIIKEKTLSKSEAEAKLTELSKDGFEYKIEV